MSQSINKSLVLLDGGRNHSEPAEGQAQVNDQAASAEAVKTEENISDAAGAGS